MFHFNNLVILNCFSQFRLSPIIDFSEKLQIGNEFCSKLFFIVSYYFDWNFKWQDSPTIYNSNIGLQQSCDYLIYYKVIFRISIKIVGLTEFENLINKAIKLSHFVLISAELAWKWAMYKYWTTTISSIFSACRNEIIKTVFEIVFFYFKLPQLTYSILFLLNFRFIIY